MKNRAFTLIELLVVVLIIGILAAIALPQYTTAVAKSRLATMLPMIKSLEAAKESYYLANGEYPYSTELFDVSPESICTHLDYDYYDTSKNGEMLTCGKYFLLNNQKSALDLFYCPDNTANFDSCLAKGDYRVIFSHPSSNKPNIITCYVLNGSKLGKKICYGFPGFEVVE